MSNPNKLAWKGTPGPWLVDKQPPRRAGGVTNNRTVIYRVADNFGPYQTVADIFGDSPEQCKANAHMANAAPEAIEFIADFLDEVSKHSILPGHWTEIITRAEEILKKAYNF